MPCQVRISVRPPLTSECFTVGHPEQVFVMPQPVRRRPARLAATSRTPPRNGGRLRAVVPILAGVSGALTSRLCDGWPP